LDIKLSNRVEAVEPSATLAITARAKALKAAGKDIIGLGAGEPDFDTPDHIKQAAIQAIRDGFTKYTAVDGTPELKQAIIDKFRRDNGLEYAPDQVLVSCGGKQSFYNLAQALLDPGDEVIIPAPYWVSYPDMVLLAGGKPVIVEAGIAQGFKISPERLEAAITPRTRLLVINSPSRRAVRQHRQRLSRTLPSHHRPQRCLQGLLHDRLAYRLRRGSGTPDRGDEEDPVAEHLQSHLHLPGGCAGCPGGASRLHHRCPEPDRRRALPPFPGGLLRLPPDTGGRGWKTISSSPNTCWKKREWPSFPAPHSAHPDGFCSSPG